MKAVLFYCGVCAFLILASIALRSVSGTSLAGPLFAFLMLCATGGIIAHVVRGSK